jgi:hypothetical protein
MVARLQDFPDDLHRALEAFLIENDELKRLETLIAEFNLFEAIGMVQQEIRHSHLLAFLFDPNGNHGLGSEFLKRFLMRLLQETSSAPLTRIELDLLSMDATTVQQEWENVDILIHDPVNRIACLIENKVYSGEHDNQLDRYYESVKRNYPDHRIIAAYLSPDGLVPTDERFTPISYGDVAETIDTSTGCAISDVTLHDDASEAHCERLRNC